MKRGKIITTNGDGTVGKIEVVADPPKDSYEIPFDQPANWEPEVNTSVKFEVRGEQPNEQAYDVERDSGDATGDNPTGDSSTGDNPTR